MSVPADGSSKQGKEKRDFTVPPFVLQEGESKFMKKVKENPFVPVGLAATVLALGLGLYNFHAGNAKMQQRMMRARVVAQGSTVLFLIGGILIGMRKEYKD